MRVYASEPNNTRTQTHIYHTFTQHRERTHDVVRNIHKMDSTKQPRAILLNIASFHPVSCESSCAFRAVFSSASIPIYLKWWFSVLRCPPVCVCLCVCTLCSLLVVASAGHLSSRVRQLEFLESKCARNTLGSLLLPPAVTAAPPKR